MKAEAQTIRRKAKLLRLKNKASLLRQQAKDLRADSEYASAIFATILADACEKEARR